MPELFLKWLALSGKFLSAPAMIHLSAATGPDNALLQLLGDGIQDGTRQVRAGSTLYTSQPPSTAQACTPKPPPTWSPTSIRLLDVPFRENTGQPVLQLGRALLFHLLSKLYEHASVIITTNLVFAEWSYVWAHRDDTLPRPADALGSTHASGLQLNCSA